MWEKDYETKPMNAPMEAASPRQSTSSHVAGVPGLPQPPVSEALTNDKLDIRPPSPPLRSHLHPPNPHPAAPQSPPRELSPDRNTSAHSTLLAPELLLEG